MDNVIAKSREVTLLEILDRVLDKGVFISGDITISVADVDLIYLGLKVLLSSVETMERLTGVPIEGPIQELTFLPRVAGPQRGRHPGACARRAGMAASHSHPKGAGVHLRGR